MRSLPIGPEAKRVSGPAKLFITLTLCIAVAQGCSLVKGNHEIRTNFRVKVNANTGRFHESEPDEGGAHPGAGTEDDAQADQAETANTAAVRCTPEQAKRAALAFQPGRVTLAGLEVENGFLVYSVRITAANGQKFDVKVDADTGKVLNSEPDNDAEHGTGGKGRRESD